MEPKSISYINELSVEQKDELFRRMEHNYAIRPCVAPAVLRGIDAEGLASLENPSVPAMAGPFWISFVRCRTPNGRVFSAHQVYQYRYPAGSVQRKVFTHVLAYASTHEEPLPVLGRGASIDHLCGQKACSNPSHLTLAVAHRDNVARIGCLGVTLIVAGQSIVHMVPCPHASGDGLTALRSGCAKVHVIRLPQGLVLA